MSNMYNAIEKKEEHKSGTLWAIRCGVTWHCASGLIKGGCNLLPELKSHA